MRGRRLILIGSVLSLLSCSESSDKQAEDVSNGETEIVTPRTNLADLNELTSIGGGPKQVWWLRVPMGVNPGQGVPGPTDIMLEAVIDYGSAEAAAAVVQGSSGLEAELAIADWHPASVKSHGVDGKIAVLQHLKVEGFDKNTSVSVLIDVPSFIIIRQLLG